MMKLNIFSENICETCEVDERGLLDAAKKILEFYLAADEVREKSCLSGVEFDSISFDILYCGSGKTHEINREYRGKNKPADIITFAIFADSAPGQRLVLDGEVNLGEIIISLDEAQTPEKLVFLLSHGILHLLGFDHQTEADYNFIIRTQEEAVGSL